jgi:hypothetical protein
VSYRRALAKRQEAKTHLATSRSRPRKARTPEAQRKNLPQPAAEETPGRSATGYEPTGTARGHRADNEKSNGAAVLRFPAAARSPRPASPRRAPAADGRRGRGRPRQRRRGPRVAGAGPGLAGARRVAAPRRRPRRRGRQIRLPVPPLRAAHPRGGPHVWSVINAKSTARHLLLPKWPSR